MSVPQSTIDSWFEKGDKPTAQQFAQAWRSFWHKDEKIPVTKIEGLADLLSQLQALFPPAHFTWSGTGMFLLKAGRVFDFAIVKAATANYSCKIGTTPGGDELLNEMEIPADKSIALVRLFKADVDTILYFSDLPNDTDVNIYIR